MYDKDQLCKKITELYPDIGSCGIDINVDFDCSRNAWAVKIRRDEHVLKHYLDKSETNQCLEGEQCIALGLDIAQLRKNIENQQF
jgi:hypothetical protein